MFFKLYEKYKNGTFEERQYLKISNYPAQQCKTPDTGLLATGNANNIELISTIIETVASNEIENIAVNIPLADKVDQLQYRKDLADEELRSYFDTIKFVKENYSSIDFTKDNVLNLHNMLFKETSKSNYGSKFADLGNSVEIRDRRTNQLLKKIETAPGAKKKECFEQLMEWAHINKSELAKPYSVAKSVFLADFLMIHPFIDGNGRISRIIHTLLNLSDYAPTNPLFRDPFMEERSEYYKIGSISQVIRANEYEYKRYLRELGDFKVNQDNFENIGPWICFIIGIDNIARDIGRQYYAKKLKIKKPSDIKNDF